MEMKVYEMSIEEMMVKINRIAIQIKEILNQ